MGFDHHTSGGVEVARGAKEKRSAWTSSDTTMRIAWSQTPAAATPQAEAHPRRKGWQERPGEELQAITCDYNAPMEVTSWQRAVLQEDERTQLETIVGQMANLAALLRPKDAPSKEAFMMLAEQAVFAGSQTYGERQALEWAEGYELPEERVLSDSKEFEACGNNLCKMAEARLKAIGKTGFTAERARAAFDPNNPHLQTALDVAGGGHGTAASGV